MAHISYSIYLDCGYPKGYQWLLNIFMISLVVLFMNFYLKAYRISKNLTNGSAVANKLVKPE